VTAEIGTESAEAEPIQLPNSDRITITREQAENFLFREARFADDRRFDDWEALWTDDALYWVPAGADSLAAPDRYISVIYDNRSRIGLRVAQLKTGKRHSQDPASGVVHLIGNVEVVAAQAESVETQASFVAYESRSRGLTTFAGTVQHTLTRIAGDIKMSRKVVKLVDREHALSTLSFLI